MTPVRTVFEADAHRWIRAQRLFFDSVRRESSDPVQLAQEISLICNLRRFDALTTERGFLHSSSLFLLGDIAITTAAFMPQMGSTGDFNQCLIELPLADRGGTVFVIEGRRWACLPGCQGLFLPGQAMDAVTPEESCTLGYNLEPTVLAETLMQVAPQRFHASAARAFVQRPHRIDLGDVRVAQIAEWLKHFLRQLEQPSFAELRQQRSLLQGYEQVLYRATVCMLCPDLIRC
jgi:hypothetical protein